MADPRINDLKEVQEEQKLVASRSDSVGQSLGQDQSDDLIGRVVGGKYRIDRCIGSGGMGTIYEAEDLSLQRRVAVKLLKSSLAADDHSFRRFQQEAKAASRLNHANIVKVFEFGLHNEDQPYIVMELLEGITLQEMIKRGQLPVSEAMKLIVQVARGLVHAHQNKVIHRDLKTSNILISSKDGEEIVKIVDFGIAKIAAEDGTMQSLTSTGEIFGSPLYMSPEQCSGEKLDGRSDIYSLGCVLFECLTGVPPHIGDTPLLTLMKHQQEQAASLAETTLGGKFPADLEHIVAKMLAKSPDDRYSSAVALEFELSNLVSGRAFEEAPTDDFSSAGEESHASLTSFRQFQPLIRRPSLTERRARGQEARDNRTITLLLSFGALIVVVLVLGMLAPKPTKISAELPLPKVIKAEQLRVSDYASNDVSDSMIAEYSKYPMADTVILTESDPSPDQWRKLSLMKHLKNLDLTGSKITDSQLANLSGLPLQMLNLSKCLHIDGTGLKSLQKIKSLHILNLSDSAIKPESLKYLNGNVRDLNLMGDTLKDATLTELLQLPNLHRLSIRNQKIESVEALCKMKQLEYLDLRNTLIDNNRVRQLSHDLPNCDIEYTSADDLRVKAKFHSQP